MKDSNHISGLTSAFRAAHEQSNLRVGLISAFDRHTCINRSIAADHALAHALEFGAFSSPEAAIHLASAMDRDLWQHSGQMSAHV